MIEGKLNKWTNLVSQWQTRWVVLESDLNLLSYYTSREKMMKGVRRGCVRLRGALIGIDDQDLLSFTITVDHKTFHFQARTREDREKWVRHLEETISQNTDNRSGCIDNSLVLYKHSVSNQKNLLRIFDRKVSEADVYLQLIIERICTLEKRIAEIEDPEVKSCYITLQQQFSKMLDSIKHSIVLLQISKNTAVPINGTFTGDKLANGEDAQSSQGLDIASKVFPDTSYSSSEGEDDYFDAHDDSLPSHAVSPTNINVRSFNDSLSEDQFMTCDENLNISKSTSFSNEGRRESLPMKNDGSIDYDAIYEDDSDNDISMESQRSVVGALLSQVKIGMDLTKVVLPTFILERRSLLEMYADYFAHPDLFLRIADMPTSKDRIIQVVRWYLSAYHAGRKKSDVAKKPYNPIIGEVFKCHWNVPEFESSKNNTPSSTSDGPIQWCRNDQLVFVAEQVMHHPPISAFYAEHVDKKISFSAYVWTKSKFLGLSIGVHNIGQGVVTLCDLNEEYIVTFPNGYGRSILTVPWIELGGTVTITCKQTGYRADIEFLTKPFYGGKRNKIQAEIYPPHDKKSFMSIQGEWSGLMEAKWNDGSKSGSEVFVDVNNIPIFKKQVRPIMEQDDYESRKIWRDVTLGLKLNDIEKATAAKFKIEQKQREEAKLRKEENGVFQNTFFEPIGDQQWQFRKPLNKRISK